MLQDRISKKKIIKKAEIKDVKTVKIDLDKLNKPLKSNFKTLAQLNEERNNFKNSRFQSFNKLNKKTLIDNDEDFDSERHVPAKFSNNDFDEISPYTTNR